YAGSAIAYDDDVAFAVDWQIEHSSGGFLVMNGFDAREPVGKPDHGFGGGVAGGIKAPQAAQRTLGGFKKSGGSAGHPGCVLSELKIERVLKPHDLERAVGVGLVAHPMVRDEADDRAELMYASE